jgi:uncharacterized protein
MPSRFDTRRTATYQVLELRRAVDQRVVARRALRPRGALRRWMGLLMAPPLAPGEALWLDPCGGVHTWGLRMRIDVVFLDSSLRVLKVVRNVPPWRLVFAPRGTRSVLEFARGHASPLQPGDAIVSREPGR